MLLAEPEAPEFAEAIAMSARRALSVATWLESAMIVTTRRGSGGRTELDRLLGACRAELVPVDAAQAEIAYGAWLRYGKGRHEARLNLGDCFAYALAKQRGEPLLFKGEYFAHTDVLRGR